MTDWKRKLIAYLHDPPSKALDIRDHEEHARTLFRQAGFDADEASEYAKLFAQPSDWAASAADRLPFPKSSAAGVRCHFDGHRNQFHHPLALGDSGDSAGLFPFHAPFTSVELARETDQGVQPVLAEASLAHLPEPERWRARFFAHWRLWPRNCIEKDYRFAFLPADTRLPDHTVWTHMQVVSALDACGDRPGKDAILTPAFLKFQLGPVQDFIAAARSIRDLWSGSYLLSWLMAAGMKALSAEIGPDAIIFPNLVGQPLFDLQWRDDLWSKVRIGDKNVWESLDWANRELELLTPNLPSVFLAVVPAERAAELGKAVERAVCDEWKRIAETVWAECKEAGLTRDEGGITEPARKVRFDAQVTRFLSLSWQATRWPGSLEEALKLGNGAGSEMPIQKARERVQAVVEMATKQMRSEDRDGRYYIGGERGPKERLNNVGLGWSVVLAFNSWALDAVRRTRCFQATNTGGWQTGAFNNKDALTGRDEAVAGGGEWSKRAAAVGGFWKPLFKKGDWVSASTLVKRVWHRAYLEKKWKLQTGSKGFPMPNTRGVAGHQPEEGCGDDETAEDAPPSEKYFAVLAFDGDEIGKWVSGEKTPRLSNQLADYHDGSNVQRFGSKLYFEKLEFGEFLQAKRPLSPSYHLQFSEALANFALVCARAIVKSFDGRLIYAGGDDVLALLPADTALACGEALRRAYRGGEVRGPNGALLFSSPAPGFLCRPGRTDQAGRPIPFLVPGPAADASVGIAMAHFKSPLQDVVRAAQAAEKRAKSQLGRSAVAVTLFKRSGETIEWGCNWGSGGLDAYRALAGAVQGGQLSGKFPYRIVELLAPYLDRDATLRKEQAHPEFESVVEEIIQREIAAACDRQRGPAWTRGAMEPLAGLLRDYIRRLQGADKKLRALIGLCQTVAFANRTHDESATSNQEPA